MNELPSCFNAVDLNSYIIAREDEFFTQKLEVSDNLFDFAKHVINDENLRLSNKKLLDKVISKLENAISNGDLSSEQIDEITQLSERTLHLNTYVTIYIRFKKITNKTTIEINHFLLENLKRLLKYSNEDNIPTFILNEQDIDKLNQYTRIILARDVVLKNPESLSAEIRKYKIDPKTKEGYTALLEIAKIAAQQDGFGISQYIQNYGFDPKTQEGHKALLEIATLDAQQNNFWISSYIQNYGFDPKTEEGHKALFEIAKTAAQQDGLEISQYIQNYGFDPKTQEGHKALLEIAKIAAQQNGSGVSQYIQNYGFDPKTEEGHKALFEIAKIAAQQNGKEISQYIQNYGFDPNTEEGHKALLEIAKIAAQQSGYSISQNIRNYNINPNTQKGQIALIEIAKLSAQEDGKSTSFYIENFQINPKTAEGHKALFEIATIAAKQNGMGVSQFIQNYHFDPKTEEGYKALFEIAKTAAQQDGMGVSQYIRNYHFDPKTEKGRKALVETAKIAAQQSALGVSRHILNYWINSKTAEGQKELIEIATIAAQQNGKEVSQSIRNYQIEKPSERLKILILAFQQTLETNGDLAKIAADIYKFRLPDEYPFSPTIELIRSFSTNVTEYRLASLKLFFHNIWPEISIDTELETIRGLPHDHHQQLTSNWLAGTALTFANNNVNGQKIQSLKDLNFFKHVLSLHYPSMRYIMTKTISDFVLNNDNSIEIFTNLLEKNNKRKNKRYIILASVLLMKLGLNLLDLEKVVTLIESKTINAGRVKHLQSMFKHYPNAKALLEALNLIGNETTLSSEIKRDVLMATLSLDPPEFIKSCGNIRNLAHFNSLYILSGWEPENTIQINTFLEENFQIIIREFLPFKANNIKEFSLKFEKTFAQNRVFENFKTYIAALHKLPNEQKNALLELLASYAENVMESNEAYKNWRYSEDGSHLKTIFSKAPYLRESWTINIEAPLTSMLKNMDPESTSHSFSFKQELLNALNDNHISRDDYPNLYLYTTTNEAKKIQLSISKEHTEEEKKKLGFEIAAIALCSETTVEKQQSLLRKIDRMSWLPPIFKSQVQAWKDGLANSRIEVDNPYKDWTIQFSDNPFDLFLCGTEIKGSCQNVNEEIGNSKCLLAYVTDGKNKLVEVKGSDGTIKARAVIRLLLDDDHNPVLFLERIYPAGVDFQLANAIIQMAKNQAARMGLPLLSKQVGQGKVYPQNVTSLGSRAPFEYVDASSCISLHGRFVINNVYLL